MRTLLLVLLLAGPPGATALEYRLGADPARGLLQVTVCGDAPSARFWIPERAQRHLASVSRSDGAALRREGRRIEGALADGSCLQYAIDARSAEASARHRADVDEAAHGWLLPGDLWLWSSDARGTHSLRLELPPGWDASLPWPREADGRYRIAGGRRPSWTAFGPLDQRTVQLGQARWRVAVFAQPDAGRREQWHRWMAGMIRGLAEVNGDLPLPQAQVLLVAVDPGRRPVVPWGQTTRGGGFAVHLYVRADAGIEALRGDWTGAHELAHAFHPYLGARGRWLAEGLASYYQNVLRARVGQLDDAEAWRRLHAGFGRGRRDSQSLPLEQVSRRMGELRAHMRTYWSGAALMLQADVALRARGSSLDAVLGRFAACCLPARRSWTPERWIAELDRLSGADVFAPLYRRYATSAEFPPLEGTYARIGLDPDSGRPQPEAGQEAARLRAQIMGDPPLRR